MRKCFTDKQGSATSDVFCQGINLSGSIPLIKWTVSQNREHHTSTRKSLQFHIRLGSLGFREHPKCAFSILSSKKAACRRYKIFNVTCCDLASHAWGFWGKGNVFYTDVQLLSLHGRGCSVMIDARNLLNYNHAFHLHTLNEQLGRFKRSVFFFLLVFDVDIGLVSWNHVSACSFLQQKM